MFGYAAWNGERCADAAFLDSFQFNISGKRRCPDFHAVRDTGFDTGVNKVKFDISVQIWVAEDASEGVVGA